MKVGINMKVLYDITVLGLGYVQPKARTGVFRVVENVVEHLVVNDEVQVSFSSQLDSESVANCINYLNSNELLSHVPFLLRQEAKRRTHDDMVHHRLDKRINNSKHAVEKISGKIASKSLKLYTRMLNSYQNDSFFYKKMLEKNVIYHSPFFPIPHKISEIKGKNVFITSHDLIPILYPHFSEESNIDVVKNVLNSITFETWVLCVSSATRNDLLNYLGNRVNPDRVLVTQLAASSNFYQSTKREKAEEVKLKYNIPDVAYILSVCTLEPRKNIDQVIRAFIKIVNQEHIQDLNLVLVGMKGWMFEKIFQELGESNVFKNRVIVTGYVVDEDLAALYSNALMFAYPSFYEGFGLPPLEAMQCGVPVITSNTSSLPEVVGDAAITIAPTDTDALCEAMLTLYKNSHLRSQMMQRSLERAKQFSWERCVNETVNAYKLSLM